MSLRGPAGLMEGKVEGTAPSTLAFALLGRASNSRRNGMAEESGIVIVELERWMQHVLPGFRSQK